MKDFMTIKEASIWASKYIDKNVTPSNISYLIQYGRIQKHGDNGNAFVNRCDLEEYYNAHYETKENQWKKQLGNDLNWHLSFSKYKESETTKHVHRLHPYKGKFIPQLVEYFLDEHTDNFKKQSFFNAGDIILDPFCGSGTTLVQANELNLHSIGVDVSAFNAFISNIKIGKFDIEDIKNTVNMITQNLENFQKKSNIKNIEFEKKLSDELKIFNNKFFPTPKFKHKVIQKEIDEKSYGKQKSDEFLKIYHKLIDDYNIPLKQNKNDTFLDKWFLQVVRNEINFIFKQIQEIQEIQETQETQETQHTEKSETKKVLALILSRTIRSCRATTHADLATLKEPVITTYYCKKHGKICKPVFSISSWWKRYAKDTINRLIQFDKLRTDTLQQCIVGDSRSINIVQKLEKKNPEFSKLMKKQKIAGIFSSPPYVGLINYHEQHAYAYDLFGFERKDELEIGSLYNGQGLNARKSYIKGIADVLTNCKQFLKKDYDIFLVANDKYGLYPQIAELSNMKIVNEYKRPVLNRVEKNRSAYSETIFHLKQK